METKQPKLHLATQETFWLSTHTVFLWRVKVLELKGFWSDTILWFTWVVFDDSEEWGIILIVFQRPWLQVGVTRTYWRCVKPFIKYVGTSAIEVTREIKYCCFYGKELYFRSITWIWNISYKYRFLFSFKCVPF